MVGLVGTLFFYSQSVIALEPPALGTYVPVVFAYAVLVVLSCTSQDLYRTPRDRGVLEETLMVLKAVSLATAGFRVFVIGFVGQGGTLASRPWICRAQARTAGSASTSH